MVDERAACSLFYLMEIIGNRYNYSGYWTIMERKDFSKRKSFPGTTGNRFDVILHFADIIQKIPLPIFAAILLGLAIFPGRGKWYLVLGLWIFQLSDWVLLASLSYAGKSFGPAKPSVLILATARIVVAFFPLWIAIPAEVIGTGLVFYGFWIEPHAIRLTHQILKSPKLGKMPPLRIMHLGDLHVERVTQRERQLNEMIRSLKPNIILFSGDFLNLSNLRDPASWKAMQTIVGEWTAEEGVYAVLGSPAVDLPDVIPGLVDGLPLQLLNNQVVKISYHDTNINILGLTCSHKPFIDAPELNKLVDDVLENEFTLLLYHSPDLAPDAAAMGIDLQLSGHTHGGQVRLPWVGALYTGSLYGKVFESGRKQIGNMTLYISRGIGLEGAGAPRVRFFCPPEIILWELSGTSD